ncbi:DNA repair (Rad51) family protein isoform X3 [Wolffia australiana]
MANKLISQIGLPTSMANIFAARSILTAKDALSMTEFELMALLDVDLDEVKSAVSHISAMVCPPPQTALSLMEDQVHEFSFGHFPTLLRGLDDALCGGIPFGSLTEVVGPAGVGKTQFCLKLSLLAALPSSFGGLDGRVIYVDTEAKFSPQRIIEIGINSFPQIANAVGVLKEIAGRIEVMRPSSLDEFMESLRKIRVQLLRRQVKLLVIDSVAALFSGENNDKEIRGSHQHSHGCSLSYLKSIAELSRTPIVVTNQVRGQTRCEVLQYSFQGLQANHTRSSDAEECHVVPALGIQWAHCVTIRLIFEAHSGNNKWMKIAKSPLSAPLTFPYTIDSAGISLLSNNGVTLIGPDINLIRSQGNSCHN